MKTFIATAGAANPGRYSVVVNTLSGRRVFDQSQWRQAILFYLNEIWMHNASDYRVGGDMPSITFDNVTVQLDLSPPDPFYFAYGPLSQTPIEDFQTKSNSPRELCIVPFGQLQVENGLIRFVKNDRIGILTILLPGQCSQVSLYKRDKRGEFRVGMQNVPATLNDFSKLEAVRRAQRPRREIRWHGLPSGMGHSAL